MFCTLSYKGMYIHSTCERYLPEILRVPGIGDFYTLKAARAAITRHLKKTQGVRP